MLALKCGSVRVNRDKVVHQERTIELLTQRLREVAPNDPLVGSPRRASKPTSPKSPFWRKPSLGSSTASMQASKYESSGDVGCQIFSNGVHDWLTPVHRSLSPGERRGSLSSAMDSLSRIRRMRASSKRTSQSQILPADTDGPASTVESSNPRPPHLNLHGPFGVDDLLQAMEYPAEGTGCLDQIDELIYNAVHSPRVAHDNQRAPIQSPN